MSVNNDPEKPKADRQPRLPAGGVSAPTLHSELNKDRNRSEEGPVK